MPLVVGEVFKMARAQVVCQDTYGGTKTCVAKGTTVTIVAVGPKDVSLSFGEGMYEVAQDGSYAIAMARRHEDNAGWRWDSKKDVWKSWCREEAPTLNVRPSVALRLFRNAS